MGRSIHKMIPLAGEIPMNSDSWCSPPEIADQLAQFWGHADVDPCSNDRSIIKARKAYTWGGLHLPWGAKSYANWPYSTNDPWADKAIYEMRIRTVTELVILCTAAVGTRWWSKLMVSPRINPRVIFTKRIPFLGPDGVKLSSSPFDPALIYYGRRHAAFDREFSTIAMWPTWGR